jgi:hypothetical protein
MPAAICALALTPIAWADDKIQIAPQGSTSYVTYYTTQPLTTLDLGEPTSNAVAVQLTGVTRNLSGQKAFDNMSVRCIGYHETLAGKLQAQGSCVEIDAEGDKVFTTYVAGVHTLIGGTGKYKGISGTAPFAVISRLPSPGAGMGAIAVEHKVSWQCAEGTPLAPSPS